MAETTYGSAEHPAYLDPFHQIVEVNFPAPYIMFALSARVVYVPTNFGAADQSDTVYATECGTPVRTVPGAEIPAWWLKSFRLAVERSNAVSVLKAGTWESGGTATIAKLTGFPRSVTLPAWTWRSHLNPVTVLSDGRHIAAADLFAIEWETPTGAIVENSAGESIYPPFGQTPFRKSTSGKLRAMGFKFVEESPQCTVTVEGAPTGWLTKLFPTLPPPPIRPLTQGTAITEAATVVPLTLSVSYRGASYAAIGSFADGTTLRVLCARSKKTVPAP